MNMSMDIWTGIYMDISMDTPIDTSMDMWMNISLPRPPDLFLMSCSRSGNVLGNAPGRHKTSQGFAKHLSVLSHASINTRRVFRFPYKVQAATAAVRKLVSLQEDRSLQTTSNNH